MFGIKHSKILKLTGKDHQIPNKWTEYKILELKVFAVLSKLYTISN